MRYDNSLVTRPTTALRSTSLPGADVQMVISA